MSVDGTPDALGAVKQGLLAGTVTQYPGAMAYVAIETMVKKLNGETVRVRQAERPATTSAESASQLQGNVRKIAHPRAAFDVVTSALELLA